jgi:hypothetical protein
MNNCVVLPTLDLTFVPIAKCASSSILTALYEKYGSADETIRGHCDDIRTKTAVAFFRNPTERLWSAYRYERRRLMPDYIPESRDHWYPSFSGSFTDFVAELAANRLHPDLMGAFLPQTEYCKGRANYIFIPWDFKELANMLEVSSIGKINEGKNTEPMPDITPEIDYNLRLIYGADYRIWELIT